MDQFPAKRLEAKLPRAIARPQRKGCGCGGRRTHDAHAKFNDEQLQTTDNPQVEQMQSPPIKTKMTEINDHQQKEQIKKRKLKRNVRRIRK